MATAGAKGGSNFLATQINQRNCGHDNYHPMARPSVNTPSSPPTQRGINHEKQFRTSRTRGRPDATRRDAPYSMLMMFPKSRAFINNKSIQYALADEVRELANETRVLINHVYAGERNCRVEM